MHCVDLDESFPTSIYLQKSASIQPRTSPSKFGGKYSILFTGVLKPACESGASEVGTVVGAASKTTYLHVWRRRRPGIRRLKRQVGGDGRRRAKFFGKFSLVFGYIDADLCKEIRVLQHFQNLPDYLAEIFEIWQHLADFATFAT